MKRQPWTILGLFLMSTSVMSQAAEPTSLINETARINYSVGYQIGGDFKKQEVTLDREALVKGIEDALAETASPLLSPEEMQTTLADLKKRVAAEQDRQKQAAVEKYRSEGREFLVENARKEGVVTLPNGLQYKILKDGKGRQPAPEDTVTVNYRGTLVDGTEFDSSFRAGKPSSFPLSSVIPGWKVAIPLMKEGSKWQIFIPAELAFGERGPLADRTVIYELELLAIEPAQRIKGESPVSPKPAL